MNKRNPVAKNANSFNRAKTEINRKRAAKKGYRKHKKNVKETYRQAA
jgi:hypothetical protein